ncbi:hypothetical protein QF001_000954 [Paraburkholderia youngii]|uniref:hypothetical protein n=1 Tax=Paraburkholderia youngii TaxID=2782701 RepID=UPI003D19FFB3
MIPIPLQFDWKDPRETVVLTFDATLMLASGETLTGTPTVQITTVSGSDATPSLVVANMTINAAALSFVGKTIAVGAAVQAVASAGNFASQYLIAITCQTSNPNKVLVLKATLPMSPT